MAAFSHDTRADERSQLGSHAARRVVPGALQDRGAFPSDRVLPDLADFYRYAIRLAVRVGVTHASESRIVDVWSANKKLCLSLANCYSAHDSLGFPVLLPFCDAQSGRSLHPLHRCPGPLARTGRRPFRSCRVASPQAPTPDRESLPATIAEPTPVGPHPRRLDDALGASDSSAPVRNRTEALDTARPSQSHEQAKVSPAVLPRSPSEARPQGTERRTHPCGRRNEATESPLGLSANRATDRLGVPHPNRQRRGSKDSRPPSPAGRS